MTLASSVTRFDQNLTLRPIFGKNLIVYLVFGNIVNWLQQFFAFGPIFIAINYKILSKPSGHLVILLVILVILLFILVILLVTLVILLVILVILLVILDILLLDRVCHLAHVDKVVRVLHHVDRIFNNLGRPKSVIMAYLNGSSPSLIPARWKTM